MTRKTWKWIAWIVVIVFGPALLFPKGIHYKSIEDDYSWGTIEVRNFAVGRYKSADILHQISVLIYLLPNNNGTCLSMGESMELTSGGEKLDWNTSIQNFPEKTVSSHSPPPIRTMFVSNKKGERPIPLTITIKFTLSEECSQPGDYQYTYSLKPKKEYYWLGLIIYDALMSV